MNTQLITITSQVVTITPELAKEYLTHNFRNRALNEGTVKFYASQMKRGLWQLNGEPIIFSSNGELLDGQHRLSACILADTPFASVVERGITPEAFMTIDTGKTRAASDIFTIEGITNATYKSSIVARYFNLKVSGMEMLHKHSIKRKNISKQETLAYYLDNRQLIDNICTDASCCYRKYRFMKISVIGGYYLFLIKEKNYPFEKVRDFFYEVFELRPETNPVTSLLRESYIKHFTGQRTLTVAIRHAYLVKTWNAYISGKEYRVLRYNPASDDPIFFI